MFVSITSFRPAGHTAVPAGVAGPQICDNLPVRPTKAEILAKLLTLHDPEAANRDGMVAQIWEDGEITSQKCGRLLWQRTLHQMRPGYAHPELKAFLLANLPVKDTSTTPHAYIWCRHMEFEEEREIWNMITDWRPTDG